ncbi:monofunctional biosynthetic peptidoglycan transglycosylase [Pseudooceanicola onchidii]|uniref:monofunctional biosynthetic peptidoglycan transglycosylase n=1 Tax=Pseudooceanicola onchidii TaxID=2562279 RepID=UPI0010AA32B0|nr:monofunctional biosynthetic peptidoglycan transglycosylase [Pseudooceanicola onchidii]
MARRTTRKPSRTTGRKSPTRTRPRPLRWLRRWILRLVLLVAGLVLFATGLYTIVNPITGLYMKTEELRLGSIDQEWVDFDQIAPVMARSVVAAEDANFCTHWGFDMAAIRNAIDAGGNRGASTLTQQVVKNVYLWHGRNWTRKALEALMTPVVELVWSKQRILEVYLNMAEFDEGVFGVDAAAHHYFGIGPDELSARQAALLAAILPSPKQRSASRPTDFVSRRASAIMDGAATIRADGRAACFED